MLNDFFYYNGYVKNNFNLSEVFALTFVFVSLYPFSRIWYIPLVFFCFTD